MGCGGVVRGSGGVLMSIVRVGCGGSSVKSEEWW